MNLKDRLKYHVTGAIERGEAVAITEQKPRRSRMMRCKIVRASDDYVLNVRGTDEIGEHYAMSDAQIDAMEAELKKQGRFWLDAETIVYPANGFHS